MKITHSFKILLVFFSLIRSIFAYSQETDNRDGEKFRSLLIELIEGSNPIYTKPEVIKNLTGVFQKHRFEIAHWILRLQTPQSLMKKSNLALSTGDQQLVPKVQTIVDAVNPFNYPVILNGTQGAARTLSPLFSKLVQSFHLDTTVAALPYQQRITSAMEDVAAEWTFAFSNRLNETIEKMDFAQSDVMSSLIDNKIKEDLEQLGKEYQEVFQNIITQYFRHIPLQMKRRILIAYLSTPMDATLEAKLLAITQNCGPVMKKFLQIFSGYVQAPQVKMVLEKLKMHVRSDTAEQVEAVIRHSFGKKWGNLVSYLSPDPLNSGTIGQVHIVRLKGNDENLIAKVQHMYAEVEARDEIGALSQIKGLGKWGRDTLNKVGHSVEQELDFSIEAENMKKTFSYYNKPQLRIVTSQLYEEFFAKKALIMSMAPGKNISEWTDLDLNQLGISKKDFLILKMHLIFQFSEIWFKEAIFGSGFFHADLQTGNFHLYLGESSSLSLPGRQQLGLIDHIFEKQLPPVWKEREFLLTVLDPGICGQFTYQEQTAIKEIVLGLLIGWPEKVLLGIEKIGTFPSSHNAVSFRREIEKLARNAKLDFYSKFSLLNNVMIQRGIFLPSSFHLFNKAQMGIQKHLNQINEELDKLDPDKAISRNYSGMAYVKGTLLSLLDPRNIYNNLVETKWIVQYLFSILSDAAHCRFSKPQYIKESCVAMSQDAMDEILESVNSTFGEGSDYVPQF